MYTDIYIDRGIIDFPCRVFFQIIGELAASGRYTNTHV